MKKRRRVSNSKASPSRSPEPPPPVPKESSGPHPQTQLRPLPQPQPRPEEPLMSPGKRRWLQILALVLVVALGLWVRLEDLVSWKKEPGRAFYQGEPLLTALDGLFYLTLARDLVEGTYHPLDEKRAVPDYPPRPQPPPLISVLTAGVTRLLPLSINWVAVYRPRVSFRRPLTTEPRSSSLWEPQPTRWRRSRHWSWTCRPGRPVCSQGDSAGWRPLFSIYRQRHMYNKQKVRSPFSFDRGIYGWSFQME